MVLNGENRLFFSVFMLVMSTRTDKYNQNFVGADLLMREMDVRSDGGSTHETINAPQRGRVYRER